ncbi:hypothetical protein RSAG8_08945, partial [Rhizoctonia solani AG-8 WAC10335]
MLLIVIRDHIGATSLANLSATLQACMQKIWNALVKTEVRRGVLAVEQVQTTKDLDLPTQQEFLAQFRCDEIAAVALSEFDTESKSTRRPNESGKVVEGLGGMMGSWKGNALSRFDRTSLDTKLGPLFLGQVKNLHKTCLSSFKKEVLEWDKTEGYSIAGVVGGAREKWEERFREVAAGPSSRDGLHVTRSCRRFNKGVVLLSINSIERSVERNLAKPAALHLSKHRMYMLDKLLQEFQDILDRVEKIDLNKAKIPQTKKNDTCLAGLHRRTWLAFHAKIDEQTFDNVLMGMLLT